MKNRKFNIYNVLDIFVSFIFLILWLIMWYSYNHYGGEIVKVCGLFSAFVIMSIGAIIQRIKYIRNLGIWERFGLHCIVSGVISVTYIFYVSDKPVFDSIILGVWFGFCLLIQYSYENNKYYGE